MVWIVILVIIIGLVFFAKSKLNNVNANKIYSTDSIEVNENYANSSIKFFDSYLSLCNKHAVIGVCHLLSIGTVEFGIKTKMECIITAIDGKHGDEAFDMVKRVWTQLKQEKMSSGDPVAAISAGDSYIMQYFGCEDLHHAFADVDEYQFKNGQAIISFEREMFTHEGAKWQPTLLYIKQKLQCG